MLTDGILVKRRNKTITKQNKAAREPKCLNCGHVFTASEIAATVAPEDQDDFCILHCTACDSHNIARVEPQPGFEEQPKLVVLRISEDGAETDQVFEETVESGTYVHPISRGKSN